MKLVFEGPTMREILGQMSQMVAEHIAFGMLPTPQGPGPEPVPADNVPVDKPVDKPVNKPVETSGAEKARKMREAKAAKAAAAAPVAEPAVENPVEQVIDTNEIIRIRQRTIVDLQEAYANGRQKEVFELLDRFGHGAKSFRELTADAFVPIRKAIDEGALA